MPLRYGLPSLIVRPHISRASRTILVIIRDYKYHTKYLYQSNPNLLGLCAALLLTLHGQGKRTDAHIGITNAHRRINTGTQNLYSTRAAVCGGGLGRSDSAVPLLHVCELSKIDSSLQHFPSSS